MDTVTELPYAAIDAVHMDPTTPMPVIERGVTVSSLPAEAIDAVLAVAGPDVPAPLAMVELRLLGGAISREPEVANAVTGRDAAYSVFAIGVPFGVPVEVARAATAAVTDAVAPWTCGGLINFLGSGDPARVGRIFDAATRARLLTIRDSVDPTGLFSTNVVIG